MWSWRMWREKVAVPKVAVNKGRRQQARRKISRFSFLNFASSLPNPYSDLIEGPQPCLWVRSWVGLNVRTNLGLWEISEGNNSTCLKEPRYQNQMGITRLFIESNTALRRACAWTSHSYAIIVLSSGSLALGLFFRICRNLDMRQTNENIPVFDGCFRRFQYLKEDTEFAKMPSSSSRSYCHGSLCPANTFPRIIHRFEFAI
jgi:hypothetical protein